MKAGNIPSRRLHREGRSHEEGAICYEYEVAVADIPDIVAQLWATGKHASFAVLMFSPQSAKPLRDAVINLQYAMQNEVVGLEWVLCGSRNCDDKDAIVEFIRSAGHTVMNLELNEVHFLRVEGKGIEELGMQIVSGFYRVDESATTGLLISGFPYRPNRKSDGTSECNIGLSHLYTDAKVER